MEKIADTQKRSSFLVETKKKPISESTKPAYSLLLIIICSTGSRTMPPHMVMSTSEKASALTLASTKKKSYLRCGI